MLSVFDVHREELALAINKQRGGLMIYQPTDFVRNVKAMLHARAR